jgi:hypothetical protein
MKISSSWIYGTEDDALVKVCGCCKLTCSAVVTQSVVEGEYNKVEAEDDDDC